MDSHSWLTWVANAPLASSCSRRVFRSKVGGLANCIAGDLGPGMDPGSLRNIGVGIILSGSKVVVVLV
jgi:hypothetical protein